MPKVYVKLNSTLVVEKNIEIGSEITIGRLPENTLSLDDLAVSGRHAKMYWNQGRFVVEDCGSTNGTFLNGHRITKADLKANDAVLVGLHMITFDSEAAVVNERSINASTPSRNSPKKTPASGPQEFELTDFGHSAGNYVAPQIPSVTTAKDTERVGVLRILEGRTEQNSYVLNGKVNVIGKSEMASIKLKGWFAPQAAATIHHTGEKYQIVPTSAQVSVLLNNEVVPKICDLSEGDVIELAGVRMSFGYQGPQEPDYDS